LRNAHHSNSQYEQDEAMQATTAREINDYCDTVSTSDLIFFNSGASPNILHYITIINHKTHVV